MQLFFLLITITAGKISPITSSGNGIAPIWSNSGIVTDYIFSIISTLTIPSGNYMKIVFPAEFSNINLGSSTCYIGTTSATCSQIGSLTVSITIPAILSANSRYNLRVPKITNPSSSVSTSYFQIYFQYSVSTQIIDINDAFGTVFISSAMTSATASMVASNNLAGRSANYTIYLTVSTALQAGSVFQIILPTGYSFTNNSCNAVNYSISVLAVSGKFVCSQNYGNLVLSGLSQNLAVGAQVALSFFVNNPEYVVSANSLSFSIRTLVYGSSVVLDTSNILNSQIVEGNITGLSHVPYSSFNVLVSGNLVYTNLSFVITNAIPEGGNIKIDYGTTVTSGFCVVYSGIGMTSAGQNPVCTVSGNTATITNFGRIAGGTTIIIYNQLTIASVSALTITTQNNNNVNIDKSITGGGLVVNASFTSPVSASVAYNVLSGRSGTLTFSVTSTSTSTVNRLNFYVPSSFSLKSSPVCQVNTALTSCSIANNIVTIAPSGIACNGGCSILIYGSSTN